MKIYQTLLLAAVLAVAANALPAYPSSFSGSNSDTSDSQAKTGGEATSTPQKQTVRLSAAIPVPAKDSDVLQQSATDLARADSPPDYLLYEKPQALPKQSSNLHKKPPPLTDTALPLDLEEYFANSSDGMGDPFGENGPYLPMERFEDEDEHMAQHRKAHELGINEDDLEFFTAEELEDLSKLGGLENVDFSWLDQEIDTAATAPGNTASAKGAAAAAHTPTNSASSGSEPSLEELAIEHVKRQSSATIRPADADVPAKRMMRLDDSKPAAAAATEGLTSSIVPAVATVDPSTVTRRSTEAKPRASEEALADSADGGTAAAV